MYVHCKIASRHIASMEASWLEAMWPETKQLAEKSFYWVSWCFEAAHWTDQNFSFRPNVLLFCLSRYIQKCIFYHFQIFLTQIYELVNKYFFVHRKAFKYLQYKKNFLNENPKTRLSDTQKKTPKSHTKYKNVLQ